MTWRLKKCPRCGGDTFIEKDEHGWYEECLQCGYHGELKEVESKPELPAKQKKPTWVG